MSRAAASSALFKQLRTYEVLQSVRSGRNSSTHEGYRLLHQPRCISFCQARVNHACSTLLNPRTMEKSMLSAQHYVCSFTSSSALLASERAQQESARKDIAAQDEDPFDPLTDRIPERPVTFAEGASYSIAIFVGFAIAGAAAYAVFKELVFEPKEYKIFGKALERVQSDNQVTVRLGTPITGYGQESRNRAARQRIPNRVWTDEDGVERVEVQFFIRGPHGAGKVHSEMFKDKIDKKWKFTYLLVDVLAPSPIRLMLESYVPS